MPEESRFYRRLETWGGKKKKNGSGANAMRSVHPRWWRERGGSPKGASEIFVSPQFVPSSSQAVLSNFRINSLERIPDSIIRFLFAIWLLENSPDRKLKTKEEKQKRNENLTKSPTEERETLESSREMKTRRSDRVPRFVRTVSNVCPRPA